MKISSGSARVSAADRGPPPARGLPLGCASQARLYGILQLSVSPQYLKPAIYVFVFHWPSFIIIDLKSNMRNLLFFYGLSVALASSPQESLTSEQDAAPSGNHDPFTATIDSFVADTMSKWHFPGMAIGIIDGSQTYFKVRSRSSSLNDDSMLTTAGLRPRVPPRRQHHPRHPVARRLDNQSAARRHPGAHHR